MGKHLKRCLCSSNFESLLPQMASASDGEKNTDVTIEYYSDVRHADSCDGVFHYRLFSNKWRTPLFRGKDGMYARYIYFVLINNNLTIFNTVDEQRNKELFEKNQELFNARFGKEQMDKIKDALIRGYINIY